MAIVQEKFSLYLIGLTEDTAPSSDDLLFTINNPGGSPIPRKVTIANLAANMPSIDFNTGQDLEFYNTADKVLNYERAYQKWDSDVFKIGTEKGGSGTIRPMNMIALALYLAEANEENSITIDSTGIQLYSLYEISIFGVTVAAAPMTFYNVGYPGVTDYERAYLKWDSDLGAFKIGTEAGGSGTNRELHLITENQLKLFGSAVILRPSSPAYPITIETENDDYLFRFLQSDGKNLIELYDTDVNVMMEIHSTPDILLYNVPGGDYERGFIKWGSDVFKIGTEANGTGIVRPIAIEADVDVEGELTSLLPVATIETEDDAWFVVSPTDMKNGAYTLAHTSNGGAANFLKITHVTMSELDTLGKIVIVGLDQNGDPATEDIIPLADNFVESVNRYSSITSITGVNWAIDGGNGEAAADNISVGIANDQSLVIPSSLCKGSALRILHTGQLQLLPVVVGAVITIYVVTDDLTKLIPDGDDRIVLGGVELADGAAIQSSATAAGDYITLFGDSAAGWTEIGNRGFEASP